MPTPVAGRVRHLLTISLALAVPVAAQRPNTRLQEWDSTLTTATALQSLPDRTEAPVSGGTDGDVAEAMWRIRRGELGVDRTQLDAALRLSTMVTKQRRESAWGPYLSARALFTLWQIGAAPSRTEGRFDGEMYGDAVWRHLREAVSRDHDFEPAKRMVLTLMVAAGDRNLGPDQRAALELLVKDPAPDPDAILAWGREIRRNGKLDSALVLFDLALRLGGDASRLQLERARTLKGLGLQDAPLKAYWDGVRQLTAAGREQYRFDLAWILSADSLAAFDAVPDSAVLPWLQHFWAERDAAAANSPGDRLQEHLRRWVVAFRDYRVFLPERRAQFSRVEVLFEGLDQCVASDAALYERLAQMQPALPGDMRSREPLLDHRGLIYLRHGEPMRRVLGATGSGGDLPDVYLEETLFLKRRSSTRAELNDEIRQTMRHTESWLYWFEGGWRLLHFRGSKAYGIMAPTTLSGYLPVNGYFANWYLLGKVLPEYQDAANRMMVDRTPERACIPLVQQAIAKSRDDAHEGTLSDSDTPEIESPWNAVIQSFAVGAASRSTAEALVTFAIPESVLGQPPALDNQRHYPVHFRIVAFEQQSGRTVTIDTLRTFVLPGGEAGPSDYLSGWFDLPLSPGKWQVAVRLSQPGVGIGAYGLQRDLIVPEAGLALSDIVTGMAGAKPLWTGTASGEPFPVNALAAWPEGGTVELLYQVHGLAEGTEYKATLEVRPQSERDRRAIKLVSTDRATGSLTEVRKSLGLDKLPVGNHWVTVTVESNGRTATSRRAIVVVPR